VILTNVGESHIEFLGTEERIAEAKLEILQGLAEGSYAVLPGDQALVRKKITNYDLQNIIWVGRTKKNDNYIAKISENQQDELEFTDAKGEAYQIPLIGAHNAVNALMAIEAAKLLGVAVSRIKAGLTKVKLSAMRLELIEVDEDSLILNDAYNASPTSMRCSLELLASLHGYKYKIAVLGDMLELGAAAEKYHYEIGRLVAELKIDYLIVIGNFSEEVIVGALNNRMSVRKIRKAKSIEEIVDLLQKKKWSNRAVLIKGSRGNRLERVVELLLQK
jgi:UDP-N-acetylmuramoyl-tripeptide--D-alanyl-D-alanine ligase